MPARLPEEARDEIRALRNAGCTLDHIVEVTGRPRSTVQYILAGLRLTPEGARAVRQMRARGRAAAASKLQAGREAAERLWGLPEQRQAAQARARETTLLYRREELPVRSLLQKIYGEDLCKELFDGCVVKACSSTHVIDWAFTKGAAYKIPARMACVKSLLDKRKRVAYLPRQYLQSKTADRLRKLKVEVLAVEDLLN